MDLFNTNRWIPFPVVESVESSGLSLQKIFLGTQSQENSVQTQPGQWEYRQIILPTRTIIHQTLSKEIGLDKLQLVLEL